MRVVLDTCILSSALRSSAGASFKIVEAIPSKKFKTIVSTPVFFEYEEVLLRPAQFSYLKKSDIDDFINFIAASSEHQQINFLWRPFLPDPDDDMMLELAVSGRAEAIITYNQRDFAGSERLGVRILSPSAFIQEIKL
ncbi:MAG TPA: putative toxin-antitoxin system toxin component, PIN family [Opitutaceae bacterium]|nr:putative toxin-antitoxin system toxin component, PIN family [Opitutaceae bacterium]